MAKAKKAAKEMFSAYNPADVPDIMPFPDLSHVAFTRGEETAVPKLNDYQRSWILDVGIRNLDLPSLSGKSAATAYNKVKDEAFQAKAFQHTVQPGDREEESCLPALVTDWKVKNPKKNKKDRDGVKDGDGADSDQEEDEGVRVGMVRGYTKAGWRVAMQKVISNKRSAEKSKLKTKMDDPGNCIPEAPAPVLAKLLGLGAYTGRDKFREDRHDEIHEYSKTLNGPMNAGGKFRRAEKPLWAKEDQASWEAAVASDENVDWVARQQLVATGFQHMVSSLHASGKFRPFVATMLMAWLNEEGRMQFEAEGVPEDIHVRQSFQLQYAEPFQAVVNGMYEWAEKPLKDYLATRKDSAKCTPPVFPVSADALDDLSHKRLVETVTMFLAESYHAAFGNEEIPWAAIANEPNEYYNADGFSIGFASTGLAELTRAQWDDLAMGLASVAGEGTAGFFRKSRASPPPPPPGPEMQGPLPPPPSPPPPPPGPEGQGSPPPPPPPPPGPEMQAPPPPPPPKKHNKEEEAARVQREEKLKQEKREVEAARVQREQEREKEEEARVQREREREEEEEARVQREREREKEAACAHWEKEGGHREGETQPPPKKRGRKRKADEQLVPEDVPASDDGRARGRPSRTRKTPKEAEEERKKQLAATLRGAGKPGWEYVDRSPTKGAAVKGKRGSTGYEIATFNLRTELKTDLIELKSPGT
ncbi:hypothetical protein DFH09DRAFT_1497302 [Mycena vulgaris]|nr:hypothetical protein DFH09DRAFT_1497302 [Mycena vulgaris]